VNAEEGLFPKFEAFQINQIEDFATAEKDVKGQFCRLQMLNGTYVYQK